LYGTLLACVKYLGKCPCSLCLVEKNQIAKLGTKLDVKMREDKKRVDDKPHWRDIELARKWIYERGMDVGSVHIDRVLGSRSLVPTRVCHRSNVVKLFH
jgi:hypothetical protein